MVRVWGLGFWCLGLGVRALVLKVAGLRFGFTDSGLMGQVSAGFEIEGLQGRGLGFRV